MTTGTMTFVRGRLPDARLLQRLVRLVSALSSCAEGTLAQALGSWGQLKAAYRFFSNPRVTPAAILASARPDCLARIAAAPLVLLIQDTTTLNFTHHPAVRGLGPVGNGAQWGVFVHTALAVNPANSVALGLAAQQLWLREPATPGSRGAKRKRQTAAKESGRWQAVEQASLADLPADTTLVTVADREGDIFDWFAAPRPQQAQLLVRAAQLQRCVADGSRLLETVAQTPRLGQYRVELPAAPGRAARSALCSVRSAAVALKQPRNRPAGTPRHAPLAVTAILVREEQPPAAVEPLCWLLLSTMPVASFADACQQIYWYTLRWLVERYHLVLKSGCRVEDLQLETAERLLRAVAVCCLVAVQVLGLTYLAREQPELSCTVALSTAEWRTLVALRPALASSSGQPPALGPAMRAIAQLGGFLGRKGDGAPGPLSLWRGLVRLKDHAAGWQLTHAPPPVTGCG